MKVEQIHHNRSGSSAYGGRGYLSHGDKYRPFDGDMSVYTCAPTRISTFLRYLRLCGLDASIPNVLLAPH